VPEPTNRRGFLRELVRGAGEALAEVAGGAKSEETHAEAAPAAASAPEPVRELTQAPSVPSTLTVEEMLELASEEGLAHRADALRDLALPSTRLTPAADAGATRSRIGRPAATAGRDGVMATVAEIDLAEPALAGGPLAAAGVLIADVIVPRRAAIGHGRANVRIAPDPDGELADALAVELSTELMLPRVWAAPIRALDLVETEQAAYIRLRERVAAAQGVTAEDGDAEGIARHILLGYPTETSGTMPLMCELASRGLDPQMSPFDAPQAAVDASERWRLLLQLTQDEPAGVRLGAGTERLYLWVEQDRLDRQDLSEVWAIGR
jgi:hypothetical protein